MTEDRRAVKRRQPRNLKGTVLDAVEDDWIVRNPRGTPLDVIEDDEDEPARTTP